MFEIWHPNGFIIEHHTIAARNWNSKVLKQLDYLLIAALYLLLEQYQHELIYSVEDLVNRR